MIRMQSGKEFMARKTKEESEKTRRNLLDAAFDVFTRKGFMRATLDDIARVAGVTRGAVYWHFKDKTDLFIALSEKIDEEANVRMEDVESYRVLSLSDLRTEVLRYLAHFERGDRYAVFYEMANYRTEYSEELQSVIESQRSNQRWIFNWVERLLVRLKREGLVREALDPQRAAISLIAFVTGIIELLLYHKPVLFSSETVPFDPRRLPQ